MITLESSNILIDISSLKSSSILLSPESSMSIYVGNLSYKVTIEDLSEVFAEYGTVKRVQLPTDRETGRQRGFAFVEMTSDAEEATVIKELDGSEWMGRSLKLNKARPREERKPSSGYQSHLSHRERPRSMH